MYWTYQTIQPHSRGWDFSYDLLRFGESKVEYEK